MLVHYLREVPRSSTNEEEEHYRAIVREELSVIDKMFEADRQSLSALIDKLTELHALVAKFAEMNAHEDMLKTYGVIQRAERLLRDTEERVAMFGGWLMAVKTGRNEEVIDARHAFLVWVYSQSDYRIAS